MLEPEPARFVLRVDEARVNAAATRAVVEWWTQFRLSQPGRCRLRSVSISGAIVEVAVSDRRHANDLAALLVERGVPKAALRIRRAEGQDR